MRQKNNILSLPKKPSTIALIILCSFAGLGAVILTPALPSMAVFFNVSQGTCKLTVTLFMVGYGLGQLLYGPISNRFARKGALVFSIIFASVGSVFSILSSLFESFSFLLFGRFIEALGMSGGLVISITIIRDYYLHHQSRKVFSYLFLASAFVPAISSSIGSLIVGYFSYKIIFYVLLIYGLALFIPIHLLPETLHKKNPCALKLKHILKGYYSVFSNLHLVLCGIMSGCIIAGIYIYASQVPFIIVNTMGFSLNKFSYISIFPYLGTLFGALIAIKIANTNLSLSFLFLSCFSIYLFSSIALFFLFYFKVITLYSLLIPVFFIMLAGVILLSTLTAYGTLHVKDKSNGSGALSFLQISSAVIATFVLSFIKSTSMLVLPIFYLTLIFIAIALMALFKLTNQTFTVK